MSIEHAPERVKPTARKLISKRELLELIPLSYVTIWSMMRRGDFPKSIKITNGPTAKSAWYLDEVSAWQASRARTELKPVDAPEDA
jgi:prophage regulatory protein